MRNILIFSTNYLPNIGGAEISVHEITSRLTGDSFHLIAPRYTRSLPREEVIGAVRVHRVGFGLAVDKFLIPILGYIKARRLSRDIRFDLSWSIMASHASVAAALFRHLYPCVPLLLTLQEGDEEAHLSRYVLGNRVLYKALIRPWYRLVFRRADFVTGLSEYLLARAKESGALCPSVCVPNGVDVARFSATPDSSALSALRFKYGITADDKVVVSTSRLVEKNGLYELIEALSLLPKEYKLLLVGDGYLRGDLLRTAEFFGIADRVIFTGAVPHDMIPLHVHLGHVFARPSRSEGFGISFLEAMAAGVPVVATHVGGIRDFLVDKKNGFVAAVGDAKDIALKIGQADRDRELRAEVVAEGLKTAERYGWEKVASVMNDAFTETIERVRFSIVIATGIYPPDIGGPATYAAELALSFQRAGHHVKILTYRSWERRLPTGVRHAVFFLKAAAILPRVDWCVALDMFSAGFPSVLAGWMFRRPVLVRVGGDFVWEAYVERTGNKIPLETFYASGAVLSLKERVIRGLVGWTLRHAFRVIWSTAWQSMFTERVYGIQPGRSKVIENCYKKPAHTAAPSRKNFIVAGRPIKLKNTQIVREAFTIARRQHPDIIFEELSLPHEELLSRIHDCYAVVIASVSEVSPNLLLETVSLGKPVIVTSSCGILDRVHDAVITVNALDVHDIARAVVSLSDPQQYAAQLRRIAGFSFTHSYDDIAKEFTRVITSTCAR